MEREKSIFFTAQTGEIRDTGAAYTNFYEYELPASARLFLEKHVQIAQLGSGGLDYQQGFLELLGTIEQRHRRGEYKEKYPLWISSGDGK